MYFCSKCNYTFDITKAESVNNDNETITVEDAISRINKKKDLKNFIINISITDLEKNKNYKKLDEKNKSTIRKIVNNKLSNILFKCLNCNNKVNINETIRLYNLDLTKDKGNVLTKNDCKILSKDPILPRTRDYNCKNINCITHKKQELKESVFFKDKLTYKLNYVCCVCYTNWTLN